MTYVVDVDLSHVFDRLLFESSGKDAKMIVERLKQQVCKYVLDEFEWGQLTHRLLGHQIIDFNDKDIANQHENKSSVVNIPSTIFISASMPFVVRDSDQIWNKVNDLEGTKCPIHDYFYITIYEACISCYTTPGQLDVSTMNGVYTVDLITQKAR